MEGVVDGEVIGFGLKGEEIDVNAERGVRTSVGVNPFTLTLWRNKG